MDSSNQPDEPTPRLVTGRPPGSPHPGLNVRFDADSSYLFEADLEGSSGSFDRARAGGRVTLLTPLSESLLVSVSLGGGGSIYNFRGPTGLIPGSDDPWETIETYSAGANILYKINEQWTLFGGLNGASSGEDGAAFDKTLTIGGSLGASYAVSEELSIGLGVTAQTRLEDDPFILPLPLFDWTLPYDPQHRWRIAAGGARIGPARAAGIAAYFSPTKELTLSAGIGAFGLGGDFRLSQTGPVPGGVGRDSSFPVLAGIDWHPRPWISLAGFGGVGLFGELEVVDSNGDTLGSRDVAPAPVIGASLTLSF
jgi:hypothetical protein